MFYVVSVSSDALSQTCAAIVVKGLLVISAFHSEKAARTVAMTCKYPTCDRNRYWSGKPNECHRICCPRGKQQSVEVSEMLRYKDSSCCRQSTRP